jgi:ferrous iron transport protein A
MIESAQYGARSTPLDRLELFREARIIRVVAPSGIPEWGEWLTELGFIPGEPVRLLARGRPGGDPLVVRVGDSTFALRCAEAACVQVETDSGHN